MDVAEGRMARDVRADFRILGPLRVVLDGAELSIATPRQRALLVLLLMSVGRVVPTERLIDQLWDGEAPPQGAVTLRSYVSGLRQALGGPDGLGSALVTRGKGYCVDVPPGSVDAVRLRQLAERGHEDLRNHRPERALDAFDAAVESWQATRSPRSRTTKQRRAPSQHSPRPISVRLKAGSQHSWPPDATWTPCLRSRPSPSITHSARSRTYC